MYVISALGYVLILEQLAGRRVPRRRFVAVWARSLLGRYVPGNVLMVASRLVLGQEAGISRKVSLAASVYEQALSLGAAAAGGLLLLAAYGAGEIGAAAWLVALVPLGLVVLHPSLFGRFTGWALRRAKREPLEVLLTGRQVLCAARLVPARRGAARARRRAARALRGRATTAARCSTSACRS